MLERRNEELRELNQLRLTVTELEKDLEKRTKILLFESNKEVYLEIKKLMEKKDEELQNKTSHIEKLEGEIKILSKKLKL